MNYNDGDDLGGGLTFSGKGGYRVAVYRCKCKREQTARHPEFPGGILPDTAKQFGWEQLTTGEWQCPFCSGNEHKLEAVFSAPPPPKEH